jgi:hypothetical protein
MILVFSGIGQFVRTRLRAAPSCGVAICALPHEANTPVPTGLDLPKADLVVAGRDDEIRSAILTSVCTGTTFPRVHVIADNVLSHVA